MLMVQLIMLVTDHFPSKHRFTFSALYLVWTVLVGTAVGAFVLFIFACLSESKISLV